MTDRQKGGGGGVVGLDAYPDKTDFFLKRSRSMKINHKTRGPYTPHIREQKTQIPIPLQKRTGKNKQKNSGGREKRKKGIRDEELPPPTLTGVVLLDEGEESLLVEALDGGDELGVGETLATRAKNQHGREQSYLAVGQADGVELSAHEEEAVEELAHRHRLDHFTAITKTKRNRQRF